MSHNRNTLNTKSYRFAKYLSHGLLLLQCLFIAGILLGCLFGIFSAATFEPSSFVPLIASMLLSLPALISLRTLNKKGMIMLAIAYGILVVTGFLYMGVILGSLQGFWPLLFLLPHFWVLFLGFICVPALIYMCWVNAWIVEAGNTNQ